MTYSNGAGLHNTRQYPEGRSTPIPTSAPASITRMPTHSGLNPALTFDRFVVGQSNLHAYESALGAADVTRHMSKPLILHGGVGLGKTHLLHAIGNRFRARNLSHTVYCLSAEKFIYEWVQSLASPQKSATLRLKYQEIDLLLLDDLHFLSKEERIQAEFFHLLNCLSQGSQRLVCTCDRLPQFLADFWGKCDDLHGELVEIQQTDFELRVSILRQKIRERGSESVPLKVIHYLAKHLTEHVRQLEGVLNCLVAHANFGSPLTLHVARHVVEGRSLALTSTDTIGLDAIQEVVARYFHLSSSDLCSRKRKRRYVLPRQVAMYLAHQLTTLSLSEICQGFGQSNRTVILRSCQRIESLLKEDLVLSQSISVLTQELTQRYTNPAVSEAAQPEVK